MLISALDLGEEGGIDADILDGAGRGLDAEVVPLEELAKAVAVDEVDRRGAVAGCFLLGVCGERARGDQQALVAPACHRAAEVADSARAYTAAVALALEEDREADKPEPVDAESVDPAVAALPGDVHAVEVGLTQQPLGKPLKGVGRMLMSCSSNCSFQLRSSAGSSASGSPSSCGSLVLRAFRSSTQVARPSSRTRSLRWSSVADGSVSSAVPSSVSAQTPRELLVSRPIPFR